MPDQEGRKPAAAVLLEDHAATLIAEGGAVGFQVENAGNDGCRDQASAPGQKLQDRVFAFQGHHRNRQEQRVEHIGREQVRIAELPAVEACCGQTQAPGLLLEPFQRPDRLGADFRRRVIDGQAFFPERLEGDRLQVRHLADVSGGGDEGAGLVLGGDFSGRERPAEALDFIQDAVEPLTAVGAEFAEGHRRFRGRQKRLHDKGTRAFSQSAIDVVFDGHFGRVAGGRLPGDHQVIEGLDWLRAGRELRIENSGLLQRLPGQGDKTAVDVRVPAVVVVAAAKQAHAFLETLCFEPKRKGERPEVVEVIMTWQFDVSVPAVEADGLPLLAKLLPDGIDQPGVMPSPGTVFRHLPAAVVQLQVQEQRIVGQTAEAGEQGRGSQKGSWFF